MWLKRLEARIQIGAKDVEALVRLRSGFTAAYRVEREIVKTAHAAKPLASKIGALLRGDAGLTLEQERHSPKCGHHASA